MKYSNVTKHNEHHIDFSKHVCKLIADVKAASPITNASIIDKFSESAEIFLNNIMTETQEMVVDFFNEQGIYTSSLKNQTFKKKFRSPDCFKQYRTHRGQVKALKKQYKYVEPKEIYLGGSRLEYRMVNFLYTLKEIPETFMYIPIIETLKLVLSNREVYDYIKNEKSRSGSFYTNFRDAESFKENPFFQKYPTALRLQFYNNGILINKPLGTKTAAHKLSVF